MDTIYAFIQVMHNFGAVAVVGSPMAAWVWIRGGLSVPASLAWTTWIGWIVQALSGIGFGITSYVSQGVLPELEGVARFALGVKLACAITGFLLSAYYIRRATQQGLYKTVGLWLILFGVGATALISAAFLRWFG